MPSRHGVEVASPHDEAVTFRHDVIPVSLKLLQRQAGQIRSRLSPALPHQPVQQEGVHA